MDQHTSEFEKKLLATFRTEAQEHLDTIISGLIELEKPASPKQYAAVVETVFRETHSLKGAARSVDLADIEELCQALEHVFSAAKRDEIHLTREIFDILHDGVNVLDILLNGKEPEQKTAVQRSRTLIPTLTGISQGTGYSLQSLKPSSPHTEPEPIPAAKPVDIQTNSIPSDIGSRFDSIRISADQLNLLMLQAEELGDANRTAAQRYADLDAICRDFYSWNRRWGRVRTLLMALRRSSRSQKSLLKSDRNLSDFTKFTEFIEYSADFILNLESALIREKNKARNDFQFLLDRTDTHINDMKDLLMIQVGSILEVFPRFIREFSHDKEKQVDLIIEGKEIIIDRRVLEEMKDAFIHLIRNAIDHGIEKPAIREKKGKNPVGTITIRFTQFEGRRVEIIVSDDGAGIDTAAIRDIAVHTGVISEKSAGMLTDSETFSLIFKSGFTTSRIITDTSGRGLGLAIVMEKVNKIGGSISLDSTPDQGTCFRIMIPIKLSTVKGIVVHENQQTFVFPMNGVERVLRISPESVKTVKNHPVFTLNRETITLISLSDILNIPPHQKNDNYRMISVVVVIHAGKRLGISVDEVGYTQDVMMKGLGPQLLKIYNYSGATALATGKVVPVLSIADLIQTATHLHSARKIPITESRGDEKKSKISVLVTEDSITSRMLLKNILESGGYLVETAVDGMDAFKKLRSGSYDIVVSDVDMPRMNGFVLTERIRSDANLSETPIVLVTALDSPKDRERGMDVGADAYIVKASFDQSNLLDVVKRLVGK